MRSLYFIAVVASIQLYQTSCFADDAATLPEGRWRLRWITTYSQGANEFSSSGDIQSLGSSYSRRLDSRLLQVLNPQTKQIVQALNAMKPGQGDAFEAAILDTKVETDVYTNIFAAEYGITDRWSVGFLLPIVKANISVSPTSTSSASLNQMLQQPDLPDGHPAKASMEKLKAGLKQVGALTSVNGLNGLIKNSYGYSGGLESWSGTGFGDLELGSKYNYYRDHPLKLTLKSGVRLPTGREDDPDILTDIGFGDGQIDLGFYHYLDYQPFASTFFTWEMGYTYQLPSSTEVRVPLTQDLKVGATKIDADQKLGDYWEAGIEGNQTLFRYLILSTKYRFKQKFSDSYEANGADLRSLESRTDSILHEVHTQAEWTNLPDVKSGAASFPYSISAFYRQPVAGENTPDIRLGGLILKTYF